MTTNRRGFLALITTTLATAAVPSPAQFPDRRDRLRAATAVPVMRANGARYILGVATETVHAGDFVQIQVLGPARVRFVGVGHD